MTESQPELTGWARYDLSDEIHRRLLGALCLLIYRGRNGEDNPLGSAFIIAAWASGALCMTATHVLAAMSALENPHSKSHPSSPFATSQPNLSRPLKERRVAALFNDGVSKCIIAPVSLSYGSVEADISLIFVSF